MPDHVEDSVADAVGGAAQRVAGSVQYAADRVQKVADKARGGVSEARGVIEAQPIITALLAMTVGYVLGRMHH